MSQNQTDKRVDSEQKTFFVTGGGTGGHIYPAIAVAKALIEDETVKKVYYVGNSDNLEFEIAKKENIEFLPVKINAMPRKFGFSFLKWLVQLEIATWKAIFYIYKYKPDAIFGTGGYVSAPALLGAMITQKPCMIHDCDSYPGIVSRYCATFAKIVSIAFEDARALLKNNDIRLNGNPIRKQFSELSKEQARKDFNLQDKMTLLIMGGSQGAMSINMAIVEIIPDLLAKYSMQIIFQTGAKNFEQVTEKISQIYPEYLKNENLIIKPYFENMYVALKASDVAIARAGSLSISEICACEIASILVPYPFSAAQHQQKNAQAMQKAGASIYLEDKDCSSENLHQILHSLLDEPQKIFEMSQKSASLAKLDAVQKIVEQLKSIT